MNTLHDLYAEHVGGAEVTLFEISGSGSNRAYYRLNANDQSVIGVCGTSLDENRAFIYMAQHFKQKGLSVPAIIAQSADSMRYLQEDLGDVSLFDYITQGRCTGQFSEHEKALLYKTMRALAHIQVEGAEGFDFSVCYPQGEFDERAVMWDLNYFKYCFLKPSGVDFQENKLEDEFLRFAQVLCRVEGQGFLYRDFQSRNVMIKDDEPYFIDFQGGRRGPYQYDVASFLWQARAQYPVELRDELLEVYLDELQGLVSIERAEFKRDLRLFVLFRTLQVLGAYGYRGYFERKAHFLESIPYALDNLRSLLSEGYDELPYLCQVLDEMLAPKKQTCPCVPQAEEHKHLVVKVWSFSYKKGYPIDESGNGGGFVFDCRAVHNPGRYEQYVALTGLDEPVVRFLEEDGEINDFLNYARGLVCASVERYVSRGFINLSVAFGCTGGRHRSVYSAQKIAEYISEEFNVEVRLEHRERGIVQVFPIKA